MSFSGKGQGQCLQDQSFYGQRAGLKAGVLVNYVTAGLLGTGEATDLRVLAGPKVETRPSQKMLPHPL